MNSPEIQLFPDPVLRRKTERVTVFDAALERLAGRMEAVMRSQRHGIGIAAPQIGVPRSLALVDVSPRVPEAALIVLVNPEIIAQGPHCPNREGCMSLPDYTADLTRFEWVKARWQNLKGHWEERRFTGIEAMCVQHEIDHLRGVLFLDRVTCLKTDMYSRTMKARPRGRKGRQAL